MQKISIPSNGYNNERSTLKQEMLYMYTNLFELFDKEERVMHSREDECSVNLEKYIDKDVKDVLPTATMEQDLLELLTFGMMPRFAAKEVDQAYNGHILKDVVTKNPIHDMLIYGIYATFSEAMLQTHHTHERVFQEYPPAEARYSLQDAAPVPSSAEYFTVFDKLVQTYGRLFPHRLGNPPANADKDENSQQ